MGRRQLVQGLVEVRSSARHGRNVRKRSITPSWSFLKQHLNRGVRQWKEGENGEDSYTSNRSTGTANNPRSGSPLSPIVDSSGDAIAEYAQTRTQL